jgi:dihydropyrimidinase/dihydroorotase
MIDTILADGTVVTPTEIRVASIAVDGGKVVMVADQSFMPPARETIDASGRFVIPGLVDPHIHFGLAGGPLSEEVDRVKRDFEPESRGAAHGGVTTCLLMLVDPGSPPRLDELIEWGDRRSFVDFGFVVTVRNEGEIALIEPLVEKGVAAFKHFFNAFKKGPIEASPQYHWYFGCDEATLYRSLETIRAAGPPAIAMVHAEDNDLFNYFAPIAARAGKNDLVAWEASRPPVCEYTRVEFAAQLAEHAKCPLHFVHFSTARSVEILKRYLDRGVDLSAEVVPHTLTVSKYAWDEVGVWGKFVPPLRGHDEIDALWQGIRAGVIRHVATDHCTYTRLEKEEGGGKFGSVWDVPPGISNVHGHWLPVMFTEGVRKGRITLQKLVEVCCENNARRFGLYPKKGTIAVGSDADLVILDPRIEHVVDETFYHGRDSTISIHMGRKLVGKPWVTMLRGKTVVKEWKTAAEPGAGRYAPSIRF